MKLRSFLRSTAVFFGAALIAPLASADTILILDDEFSGAQQPAGYLVATFADQGSSVKLTMSAANLVGTEFVTAWNFNFDPGLNLSLLTISHDSGVAAVSVNKAANGFNLDGGGNYDISFAFDNAPPAVRLDNNNTPSVYVLSYSGSGSFSSSSFAFLSDGSSNSGNGTFASEAHVQGVGPNAAGSGKIGGDLPVIPVPASVWGGLGLLAALGGLKLRARRLA